MCPSTWYAQIIGSPDAWHFWNVSLRYQGAAKPLPYVNRPGSRVESDRPWPSWSITWMWCPHHDTKMVAPQKNIGSRSRINRLALRQRSEWQAKGKGKASWMDHGWIPPLGSWFFCWMEHRFPEKLECNTTFTDKQDPGGGNPLRSGWEVMQWCTKIFK